jgi:hypothetical protein
MFKNLTMVHLNDLDNTVAELLSSREAFDNFCFNNTPRDPESMVPSVTGIEPISPFLLDMLFSYELKFSEMFLPIKLVTFSRVIDNNAVKLAVKRRVAEIQKQFERKVLKKEIADLKHEIIAKMLPNAPIKETVCLGYICGNGWVYIGAIGKAADEFLKFFGITRSQYTTAYDIVNDSFFTHSNTERDISVNIVSKYMLNRVIFPSSLTMDIEDMFFDVEDLFVFEATGNFGYNLKSETVAVKNEELEEISDATEERWCRADFNYVELDNQDYRFTLLSDLTFKGVEAIVQLEDGDDAESSVAIHRTRIRQMKDLLEKVSSDILEANSDRYLPIYKVVAEDE